MYGLNHFLFEDPFINLIMYLLLIGLVLFLTWVEFMDHACPEGPFTVNCDYDLMNSMLLHGTYASPSDSTEEIITKTIQAVSASQHAVKWRVALILAFLIILWLWLLLFRYLPPWSIFYLAILIAFAIIYFYFAFTTYHVTAKSIEIVSHNLNLLT